MQLRVEYYIELIIALEPESSRKKIIDELKKQFKNGRREDTVFDEKKIGETLLSRANDITTILANIGNVISPGNILWIGLMKLLNLFS